MIRYDGLSSKRNGNVSLVSPRDIVEMDQQIYLLEGANVLISCESKKLSCEALGSPGAREELLYENIINKEAGED